MAGISTRGLNLRLWFLWMRHSYPFRWAHRPLCSNFSDDILRIGHVHLCRSCLCAYCGMVLCAISWLFFGAVRESSLTLLICLMVPTIGLSTPQFYKQCPRLLRDLLRFSMGCCITLCVCVILSRSMLIGVTCGGILLLFWRIYFLVRRKRKAQACTGCGELGRRRICTGCRLQADAVRAYETRATNLLLASGKNPCMLGPRTRCVNH
jgi:hypothetical protein